MGALATDWLVRRAASLSTGERFDPLEPPELVARPDHDAHFEFFRLLPTSETWEEAFEAAFGIAVGDFYEAFEEYRIALGAQYLPHLADDRDEPLLLFLGEIPSDTRTRLREQFETAQELFRERFGSEPVDYTVYVAANDRLAEPMYKHVFGSGNLLVGGRCLPQGAMRKEHHRVRLIRDPGGLPGRSRSETCSASTTSRRSWSAWRQRTCSRSGCPNTSLLVPTGCD